jgi:hypothetical protein
MLRVESLKLVADVHYFDRNFISRVLHINKFPLPSEGQSVGIAPNQSSQAELPTDGFTNSITF